MAFVPFAIGKSFKSASQHPPRLNKKGELHMNTEQRQVDPDMQVINLVNHEVWRRQNKAMIARRRKARKQEAFRQMVKEAGIFGATGALSFWAAARQLMTPAMGFSLGIVCGIACILRIDRHFRRR